MRSRGESGSCQAGEHSRERSRRPYINANGHHVFRAGNDLWTARAPHCDDLFVYFPVQVLPGPVKSITLTIITNRQSWQAAWVAAQTRNEQKTTLPGSRCPPKGN